MRSVAGGRGSGRQHAPPRYPPSDHSPNASPQVARHLHVDGASAGHHHGALERAAHNHDGIVQRAVGLVEELLAAAAQHQRAGVRRGAAWEEGTARKGRGMGGGSKLRRQARQRQLPRLAQQPGRACSSTPAAPTCKQAAAQVWKGCTAPPTRRSSTALPTAWLPSPCMCRAGHRNGNTAVRPSRCEEAAPPAPPAAVLPNAPTGSTAAPCKVPPHSAGFKTRDSRGGTRTHSRS